LHTSIELCHKKVVEKLERVQCRAIKLVPERKDFYYERHLFESGLTTLEITRRRGDQIEVVKILKGYDDIDCKFVFKRKKTVCKEGKR